MLAMTSSVCRHSHLHERKISYSSRKKLSTLRALCYKFCMQRSRHTVWGIATALVASSLLHHAMPSARAAGSYEHFVGSAQAHSKSKHGAIRALFAIPRGLEAPVGFWQSIYRDYGRAQVLLHDTECLDVVYDIVDLHDLTPSIDPFVAFPQEIQDQRKARVEAAMTKVRDALHHLAGMTTPKSTNTLETKILKLWAPHGAGSAVFAAAAGDDRLRSQTGLKERFGAGVRASGKYYPKIEAIFAEEGIPWEVTRLVFVESMFDLNAYSKVGASGIWQFMPGTARLVGLQANEIVDERNDPIAASHGAARLLKQNYDKLGSWPLAINAYNSGPGRLLSATRQLGTTSIEKIIHNYKGSGYGFASRNFYCEFLAALHTYENRGKFFADVATDAPQEFATVIIGAPVSLAQICTMASLDPATLAALNPGLSRAALSSAEPLPAGYTLKVPAEHSQMITTGLAKLNGGKSGG